MRAAFGDVEIGNIVIEQRPPESFFKGTIEMKSPVLFPVFLLLRVFARRPGRRLDHRHPGAWRRD